MYALNDPPPKVGRGAKRFKIARRNLLFPRSQNANLVITEVSNYQCFSWDRRTLLTGPLVSQVVC